MSRKKRYSYIKNPFSVSGWYCFALSSIAFALTLVIIVISVAGRGNVPLSAAAAGLSAILFDVMGLVFCMASLREKDRNQLFALIGGGTAIVVLAAWVAVLAM